MVAGKAIGVGAAVGAILLAAYVFRKSNAGDQIIGSLKGAGSVGGRAIIAPIEGLLGGVSAGIGGLTETTAKIGSNLGSFQDAFAAGDFQSIADGSYITKYGGPGSAPSGSTVTAPPFSKGTITDESPNDKSSIKSNFAPTSNSTVNISDKIKQALKPKLTAPKDTPTIRLRTPTSNRIITVTPSTAATLQQRGFRLV